MISEEVISLRPIVVEDTEMIVAWRNNPRVRENFVYRENFTNETHMKWMKEQVFTGKVVQFIIEVATTKAPIGSVFLRDVDQQNKKAEFGIFIGEDSARGRGYGTEAARLILGYAWKTMQLHKIFLRVFAANQGAIKSYRKAGFVEEGYFRDDVKIDGTFYDMVFMASLNPVEAEGKRP